MDKEQWCSSQPGAVVSLCTLSVTIISKSPCHKPHASVPRPASGQALSLARAGWLVGWSKKFHQHLIMKAKSLFMFETTYNYHEEDFFNPGCNPVRKEHETFLIH